MMAWMAHRLPHEDVLFFPSKGEYHRVESIDEEFIQHLQSQNTTLRLFGTRSQQEIISLLWSQATTLSLGNYINSQGEHSSTLVGAKGIGKSTALKIFASTIQHFIPNIIEVYVSFNIIRCKGNRLATVSLTELIEERLRLHFGDSIFDAAKTPFPKSLGESIVDILDSLDLRLQLLIDEIDQIYKVDGKEFPSVVTTLNDLIYFANQPSGRISIVICGSSAFLEDLITTNVPESVAKEFVLLSTGATDLNCNKFITKRVYSSMPCDLESVASITGEIFTDKNKPWLRLIAFCAGCTARNVGCILKEADTFNAINGLACPDNSLSSNNELNLLWHAIMKKLIKKNWKLMEDLLSSPPCGLNDTSSSTAIIAVISSSNWEETFVPLTYIDVEGKWRKLRRQKKISEELLNNLSYYILHLADRNWIAVDGVKHSRPADRIYPFTLLSLCNYYVELKRDSRYAEQFRRKIAEGLRFALEPRINAAEIRTKTVAAVVVTTATIPLHCSCLIM